MADKIQLTLENMIPELEFLVQEGIFTKNEVKKIIKKRRFYEYQFERKDITKVEYYKAIKYERVLEKRRVQKRKQLNTKKTNYYDFHCK
jgi:U3 small nucleolar RNA-associated protein 6